MSITRNGSRGRSPRRNPSRDNNNHRSSCRDDATTTTSSMTDRKKDSGGKTVPARLVVRWWFLVLLMGVLVVVLLLPEDGLANNSRSTAVVVVSSKTKATTLPPTVGELRQQVIQELARNESVVHQLLQLRHRPQPSSSPPSLAPIVAPTDTATSASLRLQHVQQWRAQLLRDYYLENTPENNWSSISSPWTTTHWPQLERSLETPNRANWVLQHDNKLFSSSTGRLADVQIVGLHKAGTSQLYHILTHHSQLQPFDASNKEACPLFGNETLRLLLNRLWATTDPQSLESQRARQTLQQRLVQFHQQQQKQQQRQSVDDNTTSFRTVNACLSIRDVVVNYEYLSRPPSVRFILLLRDPADWWWSFWNFYVEPSLDGPTLPSQAAARGIHPTWTQADWHYRSPELFHELVVGHNKTVSGRHLLRWQREALVMPLRLVRWFGRENVLILKSEDMMPERIAEPRNNNNSFLDRVADFVGVSRNQFDPETYTKQRNCGDSKGDGHVCNATKKKESYRIAGFRAMLPETRKIIYMQTWQQCRWWADEFQVEYPECLQAFDEEDNATKQTS